MEPDEQKAQIESDGKGEGGGYAACQVARAKGGGFGTDRYRRAWAGGGGSEARCIDQTNMRQTS